MAPATQLRFHVVVAAAMLLSVAPSICPNSALADDAAVQLVDPQSAASGEFTPPDGLATLPDQPSAPEEPSLPLDSQLPSQTAEVQPARQVQAPAAPPPHKSMLQRMEERAEQVENAIVNRVPAVVQSVEHGLEKAESAVARRLPGVVHEVEREAKRLERGAQRVEQEVQSELSAGAHHLAEEAREVYDAVRDRHSEERREERIERHHERYVIQPNDSYWVISQKLYGSGGYFKALYWHNRADFPRANDLRPGDVISTPELAMLREQYPDLCPMPEHDRRRELMHQVSASGHQHGHHRVYVVAEGDTLFDIAHYELGKSSRWVEIYELNRQALGDSFDYLTPGLKLALPAARRGDSIAEGPSRTLQR